MKMRILLTSAIAALLTITAPAAHAQIERRDVGGRSAVVDEVADGSICRAGAVSWIGS